MQYTKRGHLTILELEKGEESVSIEELGKVLVERPSNMIYCELGGKLTGIISTGDIQRAYWKRQDRVYVNKNFTHLCVGQCMKARTIFREKEYINALPVVTGDNMLIGDYTRWDDFIILEYGLNTGRYYIGDWCGGQNIFLVRPCSVFAERQMVFDRFKEYLDSQGVVFECILHSEVSKYLDSAVNILYVDENEIRASVTVLKIMFGEHHKGMGKLRTYKNILGYLNCSNERYVPYLKNLHDKGVNVLGLAFSEGEYSEYLKRKIRDKYAAIGELPRYMLPQKQYKEFFDDLYSEEYAKQIFGMPFGVENNKGILTLKDCQSQYYNVMNGERHTVNQPDQFEKSVYVCGPCYIVGSLAEDRNTIESLLQRRLNQMGFPVKVINYGVMGARQVEDYLPRIMTTPLKKGDVIVVDGVAQGIKGIDYVDLNLALEKNNVDPEWMIESPKHCNHKVYEVYADAIYEVLENALSEDVEERGKLIEKDEDYIKLLYLDRYFSKFYSSKYEKIGSIVMNCNPFTYGHRYLIEQALNAVDFLIIFVVEEDRSVFSFVERFVMVCEGVADLENVMVVPSGPFILSQMSFPEYFIKETSRDIEEHTEQDVITFAESIALRLGIKYRFVGEEPEDGVTNQYNLAMKKILPQYGIELIEIPRKKVNGRYISASSVRKYMEENDMNKLSGLLPKTTRKFLGL